MMNKFCKENLKITDEEIGSGKYATVFKGVDTESGQELAIKIKKKWDKSVIF